MSVLTHMLKHSNYKIGWKKSSIPRRSLKFIKLYILSKYINEYHGFFMLL